MRGRYFADESRRNWGNTWKGGDFEVVEEELLGDKKRGREREKDYEKQREWKMRGTVYVYGMGRHVKHS